MEGNILKGSEERSAYLLELGILPGIDVDDLIYGEEGEEASER